MSLENFQATIVIYKGSVGWFLVHYYNKDGETRERQELSLSPRGTSIMRDDKRAQGELVTALCGSWHSSPRLQNLQLAVNSISEALIRKRPMRTMVVAID